MCQHTGQQTLLYKHNPQRWFPLRDVYHTKQTSPLITNNYWRYYRSDTLHAATINLKCITCIVYLRSSFYFHFTKLIYTTFIYDF